MRGLGHRGSVPAVQSNSVSTTGHPERLLDLRLVLAAPVVLERLVRRAELTAASLTRPSEVLVSVTERIPAFNTLARHESRCAKCAERKSVPAIAEALSGQGLSPIVLGPDGDDGSVPESVLRVGR